MKKTKIVATLGPASSSVDIIVKLMESGANVFRFNFSHGDHEEHMDRYEKVKEAEKITGKTVGILLDTKGAEIRTIDQAESGKIEYKNGDKLRISMDDSLTTTKEKIVVSYSGLYEDVKVGGHVLIDDGLLDFKIDEKDESNRELVVHATNDGLLGSRKGVNAPGVSVKLPGITEKDADDIRFGCESMNINFIAASFVRKAQDVLDIRELLEEKDASDVQILPKIESQEGIDNIDEILKVSDGMMIARGDMGVEIPSENVPLVQKSLIKKCNYLGLPVITATQMLDSMMENPRPTRAESSDVANSVWDGTDATMLSGESANGDYPIESVAMMKKINQKAENVMSDDGKLAINTFDQRDVTETIGVSVAKAVKNLGIKTIIAATSSGYTARMISKYRPDADILAMTFSERVQRGLTLNWGVNPIVSEVPATTDEMFELASQKAVDLGFAKEGELVLITAGVPVGETGTTNIMKLQLIGSKIAAGQGIGDETVIGKVVVADTAAEANAKAVTGGILVTKTTDKDYLPAIQKSSALIVENGGLTSHAAVAGISVGIPVVVGVENATSTLKDDQLITVDARRGVIYQGASNSI